MFSFQVWSYLFDIISSIFTYFYSFMSERGSCCAYSEGTELCILNALLHVNQALFKITEKRNETG